MDTVQIKNLKSIQDTGVLSIRPITVFVGKNSSGKSSLIRSFPLFKQSAESKILGTVLWNGKYVDYGSFDESLNYNAISRDSQEISFSFSFNTTHNKRGLRKLSTLLNLTIDVSGDEYKKDSYTKITYEMYGNIFSVKVGPDLKIHSLIINETDFTKQAIENLRAYKIYTIIPVFYSTARVVIHSQPSSSTLVKEIKKHVHHRTSVEKIKRIAQSLYFSDDETIKKTLTNRNLVGDYAASKILQWSTNDKSFKDLKDLIIFHNLELITDEIADNFRAIFLSTRYITPLRAAADRYYRIQNTSIEDLDPNGSNLAMFLRAKSEEEIEDINAWLKDEIGFSIQIDGSHGHASIFIIDNDNQRRTNIADTGFGISQILPVLIQVWQQSKKNRSIHRQANVPVTIIIEQPELHLHPKMQSKVGETFCKAIKMARSRDIDLRIIIETHSKDIVEAIGRSIERSIIKKEDAAIYIVDTAKTSNVTQSYFDDGGYLMQWPYGFFDGE